jgi:hypothetical protein
VRERQPTKNDDVRVTTLPAASVIVADTFTRAERFLELPSARRPAFVRRKV